MTRDRGIGYKNDLPWKLRNEYKYFARLTTSTKDSAKKNAVLMGRNTWVSIPEKNRPLRNRINIVISSQLRAEEVPEGVHVVASIPEVIELVQSPLLKDIVETVWIVGGAPVYKGFMSHPQCDRIYLTKLDANYECDVFFPEMSDDFKEISDPDVSQEVQEENGLKYTFHVYQRN
ncbi:uncharacterized protein TRIADDRAFT_52382 [Trichoplax adhaerens]|uniref:dihydrofolate reductase n=1 Tax=Trichoplax adhaerens TaxID=10228 RepID=B3RI81_TRIAD|nr:hypothetical protein TRIADDRAFT_52382 [Trichoplax adhaerens]EDV28973.1 hypothetical protein TRIADDRAFT_52382 [Trichoplax adhaerens]|eukprot:XP_002108175.1 hypothetical protein TRIADDRAFT_52382 [Trichoplax adhaerens]